MWTYESWIFLLVSSSSSLDLLSFNKQLSENTFFRYFPSKNKSVALIFEENYRSSYEISLGIGVEKETRINKFAHFWGLDIVPYYFYNKNIEVERESGDTYEIMDREFTQYQMAVNPFIGAKFYISDRFLVSLETGFSVAYRYNISSAFRNNVIIVNGAPIDDISLSSKSNFHGINISYNNLRFLTIGYIF